MTRIKLSTYAYWIAICMGVLAIFSTAKRVGEFNDRIYVPLDRAETHTDVVAISRELYDVEQFTYGLIVEYNFDRSNNELYVFNVNLKTFQYWLDENKDLSLIDFLQIRRFVRSLHRPTSTLWLISLSSPYLVMFILATFVWVLLKNTAKAKP